MTETSRETLRRLFLIDYDEIKSWLTRRLGSPSLADDAIQDTWLRLEDATPIGPVFRPQSYLRRMSYNMALKRQRSRPNTVTLDDAMVALDIVDASPSPEEVAQGRNDLNLLEDAINELSPRQKDILLSSRLDGVTLAELADRYGMSQRWIERELRSAVLHCAHRLDRNVIQRFGPKPQKISE